MTGRLAAVFLAGAFLRELTAPAAVFFATAFLPPPFRTAFAAGLRAALALALFLAAEALRLPPLPAAAARFRVPARVLEGVFFVAFFEPLFFAIALFSLRTQLPTAGHPSVDESP